MSEARKSTRGCLFIAGLAWALAAPATAQVTLDRPLGPPVEYWADSGIRPNLEDAAAAVYTRRVEVEGAGWLRLYFGRIELAEGSFVRVTSDLDREVQELDAETLARWSNTTAYFNGGSVTVELVAAARSELNRLVIDAVASGSAVHQQLGGGGQCGICGGDDRVPSSELWTSRLLPAGCTASVYNEESCMVTAGHCIGGSMVVQFNVPASNPNCSLNNPPVADQFPITFEQSVNGGVGNDWGAMLPGTNNLGQLPYERYGQLRPIAAGPASVGQPASVTGYGVDLTCTLSQTQQTDSGSISSVSGTYYEYAIDVRGGNSGSALIVNDEIVGIVTHCPCPNIATRIDLPAFVAGRETACCDNPPASDCCTAHGSPGCDDGTCESLVCACDPFCCDTEWDSFCAGEGFVKGCGAAILCADLCSCQESGCPWDISGDGAVATSDLLELLSAWGSNPGHPADFDGDGAVSTADLLKLLSNWGPCP